MDVTLVWQERVRGTRWDARWRSGRGRQAHVWVERDGGAWQFHVRLFSETTMLFGHGGWDRDRETAQHLAEAMLVRQLDRLGGG